MPLMERKGWLTPPNIITLTRILLTPVFVWTIVLRKPWTAFGLFLLAAVTDVLDGFAARHWGLRSKTGVWLDPAADKVLLTAAVIAVSLPGAAVPNRFPLWLMIIVIGRDVLIALGALAFTALRGPTTFYPSIFGKTTTVIQVAAVSAVLFFNGLGTSPPWLLWLFWTAAVATCVSGIHYTVSTIRLFLRPSPSKAPSSDRNFPD